MGPSQLRSFAFPASGERQCSTDPYSVVRYSRRTASIAQCNLFLWLETYKIERYPVRWTWTDGIRETYD